MLGKTNHNSFIASGRPLPKQHRYAPGMPCVVIDGIDVLSKHQGTLEWHIQASRVWSYWIKKHPSLEQAGPDWFTLERAWLEVPQYILHFISKWISGFLPTNWVLPQRKHRTFLKCPQCGHFMEDNLHVATCWHKGSRQVWKALL